MSKIISNTSPIIALATIGKLDLLWNLFNEVYVTQGVCDEIFMGYPEHICGKHELEGAINNKNILVYHVIDELFVKKMIGKLHLGEVETIIGGNELKVDFALIDEKAAREQAKNSFLVPIGTLGVLRLAKRRKIIEEIKPYINKLLAEGYRISKDITNRVLEDESEI